jgi:hypothetical protein
MKKAKEIQTITIKDNLLGEFVVEPHDVIIQVKMKNRHNKGCKVKIHWETLYGIQKEFGHDLSPFISDGYKKCLYEILNRKKVN